MKTIKIRNQKEEIAVGKMVCVGRNYADHAKELGNEVPDKPVVFIKPSSSIIYTGGKVIHPKFSTNLHHEVELLLLIGKTIKDADERQSEEAIIGYGLGLDMTLRDLQNEARAKGDPWTISKCFDTSAVVSDILLKKDYKLTLNEEISLSVNGNIRQKEKLSLMLFKPIQIVKYISSLLTLEEGDIIFTGTPAGVGKVVPGDVLHAEIEGIAKLDCEIV
ncbi:MAG TPA: fumarylacetoacetate hydrolase family protein [Ignavibacteriaceae bacterium]|nr:fumarylacetoacetate hydrolase family protein [Ignavibacteriaceae bacterium]